MKRITIVLALIVLLPTFAVFGKKNTDASAHTQETSEAQTQGTWADTLGGSCGGAPVQEIDEMLIWDAETEPVAEGEIADYSDEICTTTVSYAQAQADDAQQEKESQKETEMRTTTYIPTPEDLERLYACDALYKMATDFFFLEDYDCERDSAEQLVHFGFVGFGMHDLCEIYGYPVGNIINQPENEPDPLGIWHGIEDSDGNTWWGWERLDAQSVDMAMQEVFHQPVPEHKVPEETIGQGYYYLDGYYYIQTICGGCCGPGLSFGGAHFEYAKDSDRVTILVFLEDSESGDIFGVLSFEAEMETINGRKMWTIYKMHYLDS